MSTPFDASFASAGVVSAEVQAAHASEVESCAKMPGKLANAKLHASNDLQRWVLACNRLVWGEMPAGLRAPADGEIAALLQALPPEKRERLLKESRFAAEARHLVALLEAAEAEAQARLKAREAEEARAEAEHRARLEAQAAELARSERQRALREEFEVIDAAQKEARFQAWLARR
ncbi:MAG: hypothetical protein WAN43_19865 [Rhodomicrobium sp.]|jgi:hypothetical protein